MCAPAATRAQPAVEYVPTRREGVRSERTRLHALPATNALFDEELYLGTRPLRLRIVAPGAAKVAALEKHGSAYPRTVVQAESLDMAYETVHRRPQVYRRRNQSDQQDFPDAGRLRFSPGVPAHIVR